jgi:chemotaxis methyl-accepting protein methylase/methyl-accepting chemotaxis protein
MSVHKIERIEFYVRYLQANPHELDLLFKEFLIGVTSFFRDPAVWETLREQIIPTMLGENQNGRTLRAWIPGCSTGEEAYSLAMVFKEALDETRAAAGFSLQIFATDLDRDALSKARTGLYPAGILADVSTERLNRFFHWEDGNFRITKEIREMVIFAPQNVVTDPPFTKLDFLCCRNLLIYLTTDLQRRILPLFHYSLNPGGTLLLGSAETTGDITELFYTIDAKLKLFKRRGMEAIALPLEFPSSFTAAPKTEPEKMSMTTQPDNLQSQAEQLILRLYSPASVLVNENGDILYTSAKTGKYLEPAVGKANLNIFAMARDGLRHDLTNAFKKALSQNIGVTVRNLKISSDAGSQIVDFTVQPLSSPDSMHGKVLVVFHDVTKPVRKKKSATTPHSADENAHLKSLLDEIEHLTNELNNAQGEMQSSHEELKSANEELQSTNEELQSTNEELMTSKEEMQSLNEELQTVNAELQSKLDDLSRAQNDMANLLDSTDIATVFLDSSLNVRRYTEKITDIIRLIPSDIGRPLSNLVSDMDYPGISDDAHEVLRSLKFSEKQIQTKGSRWFNVRIMPYRTMENMIDGLVITFIDISVAKKLEASLRELSTSATGNNKATKP